MQYSMHLKFSNPSLGETDKNSKIAKDYGNFSSYEKENATCEKCNYAHLIYCPIDDLIPDAKRSPTIERHKSHNENKTDLKLRHSKDIVLNRKNYLEQNLKTNLKKFWKIIR